MVSSNPPSSVNVMAVLRVGAEIDFSKVMFSLTFLRMKPDKIKMRIASENKILKYNISPAGWFFAKRKTKGKKPQTKNAAIADK